jgi:putative IMPACT (imprinted ancient) family translation regulator
MKSINKNITNEIVINKSRFIAKLFRVNNEAEVSDKLDMVKRLYKDATHYCYSYIIGNSKRFNDDGEPGGTAGMPILNVLENQGLDKFFGEPELNINDFVSVDNNGKGIINILDAVELYKNPEL